MFFACYCHFNLRELVFLLERGGKFFQSDAVITKKNNKDNNNNSRNETNSSCKSQHPIRQQKERFLQIFSDELKSCNFCTCARLSVSASSGDVFISSWKNREGKLKLWLFISNSNQVCPCLPLWGQNSANSDRQASWVTWEGSTVQLP